MKNLRLRPKIKKKIYLCNLVKKEKLKILTKKGSNFQDSKGIVLE